MIFAGSWTDVAFNETSSVSCFLWIFISKDHVKEKWQWTYTVCSLQPLSCCTCNVMVCRWACWGLCVWVLMCFSASPSLTVIVCTSTYAHLIICRCANTEMRLCDSGITCSVLCSFIDCVGNMYNKKWTVDVHLFICIYAKCTYLLHRLYLDKFEILSVDSCLKI